MWPYFIKKEFHPKFLFSFLMTASLNSGHAQFSFFKCHAKRVQLKYVPLAFCTIKIEKKKKIKFP